ncbi:MAG: ATP-binding cassette domain-containing protein [Oscillospiraceae bacterium]|nr:ATP-binding cassette domain-containing protein [Oscillospiraceae bacterium]
MQQTELAVNCEGLVKFYKTKDFEVMALQGLDLEVQTGELMAIIGSSGSGKSTLLNILGGLDRPTAGKVSVNGQDMLTISNKELIKYKREKAGFVWQNSARNLISYLKVQENVEFPMVLKSASGKKARAIELLELVGLSKKRKSRIDELSGGEQQRVAIAIALANNPGLLLADEPTGSVDTKTTGMILDIFYELNQMGNTVIIVTHDLAISRRVNRVLAIRDGRASSEYIRQNLYAEALDSIGDLRGDSAEGEHEELLVIDKVGRVQLPKEYIDTLKITGGKDKVLAELDENRIILVKKQKDE